MFAFLFFFDGNRSLRTANRGPSDLGSQFANLLTALDVHREFLQNKRQRRAVLDSEIFERNVSVLGPSLLGFLEVDELGRILFVPLLRRGIDIGHGRRHENLNLDERERRMSEPESECLECLNLSLNVEC